MPKTDPIGIRLEAAEKAALEQAAAADDRSMSAMVRKIIVEWLRKHGHLSAADTAEQHEAVHAYVDERKASIEKGARRAPKVFRP